MTNRVIESERTQRPLYVPKRMQEKKKKKKVRS